MKLLLKNPGCQFCKFYRDSFKHQGKATRPACAKGARRIFEKGTKNKQRKWKWVDCSYAEFRNKDRLCDSFEVQSMVHTASQQLGLLLRSAVQETPPSFKSEMWWQHGDQIII